MAIREAGVSREINGLVDPIRLDQYPAPWEFHPGILLNDLGGNYRPGIPAVRLTPLNMGDNSPDARHGQIRFGASARPPIGDHRIVSTCESRTPSDHSRVVSPAELLPERYQRLRVACLKSDARQCQWVCWLRRSSIRPAIHCFEKSIPPDTEKSDPVVGNED